jgi:hypothetical protein
MKTLLCVTLLGLLVVGCGSSKVEVVEPEAAVAAETGPVNWAGKTLVERQTYMKETVLPGIKELFVAHHPEFNCTNCHGKDYADVNFKMPNSMKPLDPTNMPFQSENEKLRNAAQFMSTKVVPKMAGLLDVPAYDPETKTGLGCFNCHATLAK